MAARTVLLNLIGNDRVSRTLRRVRQEVDRTSQTVGRFGSGGARAFGAVGKSMGGFLKVAAKFASIGIGAALAITQAVQLVAAIAPLAGLLAGVPAAIAVAGVALGTLKLALAGVGDAFKAAMGDDAKKFEESIKGLAPAAQSVAREFRSLRPALLGIKNAAQQAFFGPLQGQLRSTAAALAGPVKAGVRGVAAEYGRAASSVFAFTRESRTASAVTSIFAGTRRVIAGIRPAMTPILQGFRDMAVQGVGTLSQLAAGAGNVGVRFGEWMQKFAASGGVHRALEGALTVVRQLGSLLANVGGILNSIITAASASGGGLLGFLGQAVAQLNAFLKTAQAQTALTSFFQTMNQLGLALAPIVPIVGTLAAQLITALAPIVRALTPIISVLVGAIGKILTAITPILPPLSAMIVSLINGLMPILTPIIAAITLTAQQIGGALVTALTASLPALQQIVISLAGLLPALLPLLPLFVQFVQTIAPAIPAVTQLVAVLVGYLVPVIRVLIGVVVLYWTTVMSLLLPVFRTMVTVVQWVANTIGPLFTWLWQNAIGPALRGIATAATWLWQSVLVPAWNGIKAAISVAWATIQPIFKVIATVLKVVLGVAFKILETVVKVVWIAIAAQIKIAWTIIKAIFNVIKSVISNVLGPVFRWLLDKVIRPVWNTAKSVISSVYNNGIKPVFDKLKSAVGTIGGAFRKAVEAVKKQWDRIKGIAKAPVNFVIDIYNKGIAGLVNKLAKFAGVGGIGTIPKLAKGGILPGYSPGVDSLIAAVSPGEAVMRPEFTRAVGSGFVLKANDVARRSGVEGVRRWMTGPDAMGGEGLAFARGGIVPGFAGNFAFGGIIGKFVDGVRDFTIGNVGKAAKNLLGKVLTSVPGKGVFRDVVNAIPAWIKDTVLKWIKSKIDSFGGPGVGRAVQFARAQAGKPYVWGGVGPGGYDCCIVGGVRIYGPDGAKAIQDVRAGDRVFTHVEGRLKVHTVTAAWQSKRQPVFAVRTRNRTVTASANHPFLRVVAVTDRTEQREEADWPGAVKMTYGSRKGATCNVSTCDRDVHSAGMCNMHHSRWAAHGDPRVRYTTGKRYETQWARLDELKRGDLLVQPRAMSADAKPHPELPDGTQVDADVAWLLGAMVGDGTVTDKGVRLCLFGDKRDRATRIIAERWGCNPGHGESYGLVASCVQLSRALAAMGMRRLGPDKRVPQDVWTWDAELQRAFLDGYCDADGHRPADRRRHGERTYHSAAEELIEDARALHIMLGDAISNITVTKRTRPITIKGKVVKHARPQYSVTVWGRAGRGEALLRRTPGLAAWLDASDFTLAPVLAVEAKGEQDTWDLEVEGAHNFVADGVVVHNSGFMSALVNVIKGRRPYSRLFTTHGFTGPSGPAGFVRGARSGMTVGVTHGGVGHMAGTLGGKLNVESRGSRGVVVGPSARGTSNGLFSTRYGLKFDQGGMLQPGFTLAYNATRQPEPVLTSQQFDALAGGGGGGGGREVHIHIDGMTVRESVDIDLLMQQIEFRLRTAVL